MTTRALSASSYGSASICSTKTPLSSVESMPPEDLDNWVGTGWVEPGPRPSSVPFTKLLAPPWDHSQGPNFVKFIPSAPDIARDQNMFSPSSAFPCGNIVRRFEPHTLPTIHTSPGTGYGGLEPPKPGPNSQTLGTFWDVPSEIEQIDSHVSLPLSQMCDLGEETSVLDYRALFSDLHYPYMLLDDE